MKVFLSHSGDRSKTLAIALQTFIRKLFPSTADPWISTGIDKGSRWEPEIAENLEAAGAGIVCLTSDNLPAPWLLFEAGALSKRLDGKVYTFLLDVDASAVPNPLGQFQHTRAEKGDVLALVQSINKQIEAAKEKPRIPEDLTEAFEDRWPKLAETIETLKGQALPTRQPARSLEDMVKEVLETVRSLSVPREREIAFTWQKSRKAPSDASLLEVGDEVERVSFGRGVITAIEVIEGKPMVVAHFERDGKRSVVSGTLADFKKI